MAIAYKIERENGDVTVYATAGEVVTALRLLGMDDYRRFSEDVKDIKELKIGDEAEPLVGVKLTVFDPEQEEVKVGPTTDEGPTPGQLKEEATSGKGKPTTQASNVLEQKTGQGEGKATPQAKTEPVDIHKK